ncbi:hypothetical protein B0H11DRAFT_1924588 [Mycena galericulata]|nr:hypothetical protein B0H11DRAFT_1924588 [Mycena galericulata]
MPPRKKQGKKTGYAAAKKANSGAKKAAGPAAAESDYEEPAPPKSRKPRVVDPRSPLPERSTRGVNPARGISAGDPNPDKPRHKRSSAEVQAADKLKEDLAQQEAALEVKKYQTLARMELAEEEEEEEEEEYAVKDVADLVRMPTYFADVPEDFPGRAALSDYEEEDYLGRFAAMDEDTIDGLTNDRPAVPSPKLPPPKPRKKAKGETRDEIELYKAKMKEGNKRLSDWDEKPDTKRPKLKPLFAAGLDADWRTRISSATAGGSKGAVAVVNQKKGVRGDTGSAPLGGVTEEDIESQAPPRTGKAKARVNFEGARERNLKRRNDDVVVVAGSDEEGNASTFKARKTPHPAKPRVKTEARTATPSLAASSSLTVVASSPTPQAGIPPSITAVWRTHFLPTLNHRVGSSRTPWEEGDFKSIEDVFNIVYPGNPYQLTLSSQVFTKARDRVYDRRTWFGNQAAELIFALFQGRDFVEAEDPVAAIAAYAAYALRPDGPMLWKIPGPEGFEVGEDGYTKAEGLFESQYMTALMTSFMKKIAGSRKDYGRLYGAIALAAGALERAFSMFTTGELVVNEAQFSRENFSDLVDDYVSNAELLSDRRWEAIMEAYGAPLRKPARSVNAASMDAKRRQLYQPSSP